MSEFDKVIQIVERYKALGYQKQRNGARLFGHVPRIAPLAYLHEVYTGLTKEELLRLKQAVKIEIPGAFADFLKQSNGLMLFSSALNIYGFREYVSRDPDDRQPFCIVTANTMERPKDAKKTFLFIGSYRKDGSRLYIDNETLNICRCTRHSSEPLNKWWDFWDMLLSEAGRIDSLFDKAGAFDRSRKDSPIKRY